MPGPVLSPEDGVRSKETLFLLWRIYIQVRAVQETSGFRNNPQAGPSTSNGERGGQAGRLGHHGSDSPKIGPEPTIFMKMDNQDVLQREIPQWSRAGAQMRVQFQAKFPYGNFRDSIDLTSEWSQPEERELKYLLPSTHHSLVEDWPWRSFGVTLHQTKQVLAAGKSSLDKGLGAGCVGKGFLLMIALWRPLESPVVEALISRDTVVQCDVCRGF